MTKIVLAHPCDRCPKFQVFGVYDGDNDGHTFGLQEFEPGEQDRAERYARWLMEKHVADHFERVQ